jgi:hypothetical protein
MHTPAAVQKLGGNVKPGAFNAFARRGEAGVMMMEGLACAGVAFRYQHASPTLLHGQGGPTITMKPKSFPRFKFEPCE